MQEYFELLNRYYDKIYVLSVESAKERREKFAKYFQGLQYSFFFGADKNKFTIEELVQKEIYSEKLTITHHRYNKTMRPGEIACAWSHKMMYEDIIKNNYKRAMIFEDDAMPDANMIKLVPEILNEIPGDCELLEWGWDKNEQANLATAFKQSWYHIMHAVGLLKWKHAVIRNLYARPFSKHLKLAGFHDYTYAYGISKGGAEKLLAMQTPIQYIADNLLGLAATQQTLHAYITYPAVFLHDNLADGTHRDSYIR